MSSNPIVSTSQIKGLQCLAVGSSAIVYQLGAIVGANLFTSRGSGSRKCRPCKFALYYNRLQAKLFRLERLGERLYFSTPVNYFLEGRRFCVLVALSGPDIEMAHKFPDWTDIIIC